MQLQPRDDTKPLQHPLARFAIGLLQTVITGAALGAICTLVVLILGSAGAAPPALATLMLKGIEAGAICFTVARYLLLSKSEIKKTLPGIAIVTVIGALMGMFFSIQTAEATGIISFFLACFAICQRDDNKGRDFIPPRFRRF